MRDVLYAFRYFRVVPVVPPLFIGGFIAAVLVAAIQLTSDPSSAVVALTPVLKLQLFAASSGFQLPARRGYYDLLLTSGTPRWQVAIAHCAASLMPGFVCWFCVALLELAASHGGYSKAAAAGTCVAFVAWSLIAWGIAVFSSRTGATIAWLVVMTIPLVARLSPLAWLGMTAPAIPTLTLIGVYGCGCLAFAIALFAVVHGTTPLEGSQ